MKDIAIRDMKKIVKQQQEENYYKPKRVSNFLSNNDIEYEYQLKNILIKLDHV